MMIMALKRKYQFGAKYKNFFNFFVEKLYFFIWDTQFLFTEVHVLPTLAERFIESKAKIVTPCIKDHCNTTTGKLYKNSLNLQINVQTCVISNYIM